MLWPRLARPRGFEPLTPRSVVWCSIQLSYGRPQAAIWAGRTRGRNYSQPLAMARSPWQCIDAKAACRSKGHCVISAREIHEVRASLASTAPSGRCINRCPRRSRGTPVAIAMSQLRTRLMIFTVAALLSGCSFVDNLLTGEDNSQDYPPGDSESVQQIAPSAAEQSAQPTITQTPVQGTQTSQGAGPPAVGSGNYAPQSVTPGASTGTYVGQKVASLRGDLQRLQTNINQHNQELQQARQGMASDAGSYYSLVASVNSRLQVGTTPGNPQLVAQWSQAQASLGRLNDDITRLNTISNAAASDSALAAYILESVRAAYGLQGAVDEDHRQLAILENDCNRTVVLIDKLLNDLSEDISRQTNYVSNERRNLTVLSLAIKNGELYGGSLN